MIICAICGFFCIFATKKGEIRYYGTYNFVGARVDGYLQPTALLTKQAAQALRAVSDDVKAQGYRLKIYDAYRPQMGVDHFVRWAEDIPDTGVHL